MEEILKNIEKNPELIDKLKKEFLIDNMKKIKNIKKVLTLKKVSYDQINMTNSSLKASFYDHHIHSNKMEQTIIDGDEEQQNLVNNDNSRNEELNINNRKPCNLNYIENETSTDKLNRLENIENKFDYINMICEDLNNVAYEQNDYLDSMNKNYNDGIINTKAADDK